MRKSNDDQADRQHLLLRTMLRASGLACLLAPAFDVLISGCFHFYYVVVAVAGASFLLLGATQKGATRSAALIYLMCVWLLIVLTGYHTAWSPAVVASLCYLVVAAGLLLGRRAVYWVVGASCLLLQLGAVMHQAGLFSVPLTRDLDPALMGNWLRVASVFFVITSTSAWVLRIAVEAADRVGQAAETALGIAQQQRDAVEHLRARRLDQENEIRDAQRLQMVAQLGDGFAHLFNNLLTIVRCSCADLTPSCDTSVIRQSASNINAATSACAERTRDLLILSRPHVATAQLVQLDDALCALAPKITARFRSNIAFEINPEPTCAVDIPSAWLEQIVFNLLLNTEQAMPQGGRVRLSTRVVRLEETLYSTMDGLQPGPYSVLVISDEGDGMAPNVMDRACEPFFTTKNRARHAGLGLTLVHQMARQLGGSIRLQNRAIGSRVEVLLPCADAASAATITSKFSDSSTPAPRVLPSISQSARSMQALSMSQPTTLPDQASDTSSTSENTRQTADTVAVWRIKALDEILRFIALAMAVNLSVLLATMRHSTFQIVAVSLVLVISLAAVYLKGITYQIRVMAMIAGLSLGLVSLIGISYLAPINTVALVGATFLTTIFGSRRIAVAAVLGFTATHVLGGWLWGHGIVSASLDAYLGDRTQNWVRTGISLPVAILVIGVAVLRVFTAARAHSSSLAQAREQLERSREIHQSETDALLRMEGARNRATRMEVAGRLTGMMAHDLNNSLAAILAWSDVLLGKADQATVTEAHAAIRQSADHAEALVQQLQHQTNASHRGRSMDLEPALVRMQPMLQAVAQHKSQHDITLSFEAEDQCFVEIQEQSFRRLLLNLVANARDACVDSGTSCKIILTHTPSHVTLVVSDDGCGMDLATQSHLFEAFFTTKGQQGTGLGLHSVSDIARGTNASVDISSEPGEGTRVTVVWPLALPAPSTAAESVRPPAPQQIAHILLAEDEDLVRSILARGLRRAGYTVTEARDGNEALYFIETRGPFDALCSDAIMPGVPITEVIAQFWLHAPHRPVIVISGYLPEDLGLSLGTTENVVILQKPLTHLQLLAELRARLG